MTPFLISLLVTLVAAPVVRRLMLQRGIIDVPNHRSSHSTPTPRGGGLACLLGILTASVAGAVLGVEVPWVLLVAAAALSLLGFADDRFSLSPLARLGAQVAAGAAMGWSLGGASLAAAGALLAPLVVNVVNFMDGINGITSLSVSVWGATAWAVGLATGTASVWLIGAAALGAALGFLPWNAPSAKLFLGDVGSYLFGGLIAAGLLAGLAADASPILLAAPLALYLVDTGTVLLRRACRGDSLVTAHREHAYQRLTSEFGRRHILIAAVVAGLAAALTAVWAATPWWAALIATVAVCGGYVASPRLLTAVRRQPSLLGGGR